LSAHATSGGWVNGALSYLQIGRRLARRGLSLPGLASGHRGLVWLGCTTTPSAKIRINNII
jgi:hypothetical protein